MNTNIFLLVIEFLFVIRKKILLYLCLLVFFFFMVNYLIVNIERNNLNNLLNNTINLLGILLGFIASIFTVLITIDNENIKEAKQKKNVKSIYKNNISIYDELIISFAILIILTGALLIFNFLLPLTRFEISTFRVIFSIDLSLIIFSIIHLINCILNFYFILTKNSN